MIIDVKDDLKRWEVSDRVVVLANADAYYTKAQVEELIDKKIREIINRYENN